MPYVFDGLAMTSNNILLVGQHHGRRPVPGDYVPDGSRPARRPTVVVLVFVAAPLRRIDHHGFALTKSKRQPWWQKSTFQFSPQCRK
jgi:hypothetical protein